MGTHAIQSASADGHGNVIVQASGDGIQIHVGLPHLALVPVQARLRGRPTSEIEILSPFYESVPITGRDADLAFLQEWLTTGQGIAVTAVIGRGGSGKTRLALETLKNLPGGWQGGFLTKSEAERFLAAKNLSQWGWQKPTLIVADYAARFGEILAEWFAELADHAAPGHPLRILLLERHADPEFGWYRELADSGWHGLEVRKLLSPAQPRVIAPLDEMSQRRAVLSAGLAAMGRVRLGASAHRELPRPGCDGWFDQRLADGQWADPLLLLMAAVIAESKGIHAALSLSRVDLATTVARRECDRVKKSVEGNVAPNLLAHLYACVTLCGGLERDKAVDIAEAEFGRERKEYPGGPGQAVDDLGRVLGSRGFFPSLSPDLLAGAFLIDLLGMRGPAVAARLIVRAPDRVAATLVRAVQDFALSGVTMPVECLRACFDEGAADTDVLRAIEENLPVGTLALRELALEVTRKLVQRLEALEPEARSAAQLVEIAGLRNNLAVRQGEMGQRAEALASIVSAVSIYRRLTEVNPQAFLRDLAMSLNNLAHTQSEMGQRAEALASICEAVSIHRQLAEAKPETFLPDLAMSLNNLANRQSDMGERAEALVSICEAVRLFRQLGEANPQAFLPYLATSLNNLARIQRSMGRRAEAYATIGEAVSLYREMADTNPQSFLSGLAMSLNNLANVQTANNQIAEAVASIADAVGIRRQLADANPQAFLPDLAMSLNNLANRQSEIDQRTEALASIREAVDLYRQLAEANPQAFFPDLAGSLNNLATIESKMGQPAEALTSIAEAVSLFRDLAEANPRTFLPDLAMSLNNLGRIQGEIGQRAKALASTSEAVSIRREQAAINPEAFLCDLAMSLNNLAKRQSDVGQRAEALASVGEAVSICHQLSEANPQAFLPDLAMSLANLANRQSEMGQLVEALASISEAVGLYRQLAEANPQAFTANLVMALSCEGDYLEATTRVPEARAAAEESLRLLAPHAAGHPTVFGPLAMATFRDYLARSENLGLEPAPEIEELYLPLLSKLISDRLGEENNE